MGAHFKGATKRGKTARTGGPSGTRRNVGRIPLVPPRARRAARRGPHPLGTDSLNWVCPAFCVDTGAKQNSMAAVRLSGVAAAGAHDYPAGLWHFSNPVQLPTAPGRGRRRANRAADDIRRSRRCNAARARFGDQRDKSRATPVACVRRQTGGWRGWNHASCCRQSITAAGSPLEERT